MAAPKKRRYPLINMDADNDDVNYRYKFEKLFIRLQGKNTGQKTAMINILQIADDILGTKMGRDNAIRYNKSDITKTAQHISKYIGKKLGAQCQFKKGRDVAIISGVYQQYELQNVLFEYVKQYAMCPQCNIPELTPAIHADIHCKSCGYNHNYSKNNSKKHKKNRKDAYEKKQNKKQKKKRKAKQESNDGSDEDSDNQTQISRDPIFAFNYFMEGNENVLCGDIMEKIKILSIAHTLDRKEQIKMVVYVLMQYKGDDYKLFIESIKKYSRIFEVFTMLQNDTEIFLAFVEEVIVYKAMGDNLLNHSYAIFNCLYDEDIIGEDEIMEWYNSLWQNRFTLINKDEAQLIRDKTKPFVAWLENAENDDED